jgi:hypothetical protein
MKIFFQIVPQNNKSFVNSFKNICFKDLVRFIVQALKFVPFKSNRLAFILLNFSKKVNPMIFCA